jgi:hypothetical protein
LPKAVILIEANDRPDKTFEKKSEDVYWGLWTPLTYSWNLESSTPVQCSASLTSGTPWGSVQAGGEI